MMNPEIKAKWVAALRSGEYTQTTGALRSEDESGHSHCCLGVLCEISKRETGFGVSKNLEENADEDTLGRTIQKWAGLSFNRGATVSINGIRDLLTEHNDDGRTFLEIADAIEAQL